MVILTYLFDLDDTIIDSSIYQRIYNEVIEGILSNILISKIDLQKIISKIKVESGKQKVDTFELCKELDCEDMYYKILEKQIKHTYTLKTKEIPSVFRRIKSKSKRIGIISQAQEKIVKIFLKRFSLDEHVSFIASGKKNKIVFWVTLERKFDLDKDKTLVIDDREDILEIAKHSGYKTLNVKNIEDIDKFNI